MREVKNAPGLRVQHLGPSGPGMLGPGMLGPEGRDLRLIRENF